MKVKNYFFSTFIGLFPMVFILCAIGSGIEKIIEETEVNFVIQINGKKRRIINTNKEIPEKDLFNLVKGDTKINKYKWF